MGVKQCKPIMEGRGHAPPGNLKLGASEIAGNMHFSIYFAFSKFSRRATTLPESLKSGGGGDTCPCAPWFLRPCSKLLMTCKMT